MDSFESSLARSAFLFDHDVNARKVNRVLKLSAAGYTRRGIAKAVGESYGDVCRAINSGKRTKPSPAQRQAREDIRMVNRPYSRCPSCGKRVQLPCLECLLERSRL